MVLIRRGFLIAAAFTAAAIVLLSLCLSSVAAGLSSPAIFTVVLDAGHGGVDPGVLGVQTKVKESDLNLMIVRELQEDFENAGFAVVLTRTDEGGLYGLPTDGFTKRDMQERKEIIESAAPRLMISVHQNNFVSDRSRRGGQVFYNGESEEGKALADSIQSRLNALGGCAYSALKGDYYMLNCTQYTSVIVECGFLSNAEDEKLLTSKSYREQLAYEIFTGTLAFLG